MKIHCSIFTPLYRNTIKVTKGDIYPLDVNNKIAHLLTEMIINIMPQNITKINIIRNFNRIANNALTIRKLPHVSSETLLVVRINHYALIMFIVTLVIILTLCIIIIRKKRIRMYNPELPKDQSSNNQIENCACNMGVIGPPCLN